MTEWSTGELRQMIRLRNELRQLIAELELCSHVSATNLSPSGKDSGEDIGGKRPPGGVDRAEDRQRPPERDLKDPHRDRGLPQSAEVFKRRLLRAKTVGALEAIKLDAERALAAWKRGPKPTSAPLSRDDPFWRRYIAESSEKTKDLANRYGVSDQYINQVRRQWRDRMAA